MKAWGRTLTRSSVFLAAAVLLWGCVSPVGVTPSLGQCEEVNPKALKYVNWARVPEVDVRIRHDEFSPMIVRLRQGWPYVLRIRNRDERAHYFQAGDFFAKVAVIQARVAGKLTEETCFTAVRIPARETVELKMVAVTDGYYEFEDRVSSLTTFLTAGPNGIIIIEERIPRI